MVKEVYTSIRYKPELVTGRYVRVSGRKGAYTFRVFETSEEGGRGPTLREYDTNGEELPIWLAERCIASKQMEKWD